MIETKYSQKRRERLKCFILLVLIIIICSPAVVYIYNQSQPIIKTVGVFDDNTKLINHDLLEGSCDFGEDVAYKFSRYSACEEVFESEKRQVKNQLLSLDKILRYHIVASNNPGDPTVVQHNMWVVEENLVKNQDSDDFRVYYFSTWQFCATYKADKDTYNNDIRELYGSKK